MYRLMRGFGVVEAGVLCCFANALYFLAIFAASLLTVAAGGASPCDGTWSKQGVAIEITKTLLFNLPQIVLLLWLMRDLVPTRFAARYLVFPLLTVIEGYVLLRPGFSVRAVAGAALMVFAAWRLLTTDQREGEPGLVLR